MLMLPVGYPADTVRSGSVAAICLFAGIAATAMYVREVELRREQQAALEQAKREISYFAAHSSEELFNRSDVAIEPAYWQVRSESEDIVGRMGREAVSRGLTLRSVAVSHQASTPQVLGRVKLEVASSGSYIALKAWQAAIQAHYPAIAVQSLRMQRNATSPALGLDARWVWVMHVRD